MRKQWKQLERPVKGRMRKSEKRTRPFSHPFSDPRTSWQAGQAWPHSAFLPSPFRRPARLGKQCKCGHTRHFRTADRRRKCLLGSLPKPSFGTFCPKVICLRHRALSLLFLFALAVRDAQQMVNVGLDRHGLPHFLLRRAVLGIERLFLRRQLAAFFF